jgi:hypothetical protein
MVNNGEDLKPLCGRTRFFLQSVEQRKAHMEFDDKTLVISHETWGNVKQNTFALATMFNTFKDMLGRGGSVKLLMADGSGIKRSIDRSTEIDELFAEVNQDANR